MATKILVIEDEAQIRENIEEILLLHGFQVETASNGADGISQALLHKPNLILCDIMMPVTDGYKVLEVIRANRSLVTVPFIFLTAKTDPADMRRGMVGGADDYLTKPFTLENLMKAIDSRLQREVSRKTDIQAQLNEHRRTLAAVSVHEYNTSLTGIIGFTSLLIDQHQDIDSDDLVSMLTMIKVCGLRLKRSLDNIRLMDILQYLDTSNDHYSHYTTGQTAISGTLVRHWAEAVEYRMDRKSTYLIELEAANLAMSEENLRVCLEELFDNAFKFSNSVQPIRLTGEKVESSYRISLTNSGNPMKPEDIARISPFTQFNRSKFEQQGFGLGLAIVKKLVELNRGRTEIESNESGLTQVTIWLPQASE
ncbi:hybrid sensor histidine kinase/response regulator [Spirosoma utsteinense]|uniref:histidine kinase n=1 Tax=Spirosoma utsteinense TaxID=2585773 RepID=A0ABR6W9C1_9BACT|nr:response regulator [Spirosoma utsteinense]MBC3788511.1 CheY-like chemotaxis protein [Spirosoma utsteinense]MBC3793175.1 CheY-like chemotaxis protein [Spirosoma utsteinense]